MHMMDYGVAVDAVGIFGVLVAVVDDVDALACARAVFSYTIISTQLEVI